MNGYLDQLNTGMTAYFGLMIVGGILHVLGAITAMLLKCYSGRVFFHLSWCLMSILMIVGFLITLVLAPVSGVFFEMCEVID